jgi:hypothetical protein
MQQVQQPGQLHSTFVEDVRQDVQILLGTRVRALWRLSRRVYNYRHHHGGRYGRRAGVPQTTFLLVAAH